MPRKKAMTRAEVEEEAVRLRSKLRDGRGKLEDWRIFLWIPVVGVARALGSQYQIAPEWVLNVIAWVFLIGIGILLRHWFLPQEKTFDQLCETAAEIDYLLCPDCGHDLRGSVQVGRAETTCPECGRQVAVDDLKDIWTEKG